MNKYEELLENFTELIPEFDDDILLRGYDLTKLQENLRKVKNEA